MKTPSVKWTPDLLAMLGREPSSLIARTMGVSVATVNHKRRELGIPKYSKAQFNWTITRTKMLGKMSDRCVGESLGLPAHIVTGKRRELGIPSATAARWTPEILADIGKMPDLDLVRKYRYKVSRAAVEARRRKMGMSVQP